MSWRAGSDPGNAMFAGDSDTWGGPQNGVDLVAEAGVGIGGSHWHSNMTIDSWTIVIVLGSLGLLWLLGGVVFKRINIL